MSGLRMVGPFTTPAAAGGAGVATSNVDTPILLQGLLMGVAVQYNDTPPATTDITIKTKGSTGLRPSYNLLVLTNANTDGYFSPRKAQVDTAGATTGLYDPIAIEDVVNIAIAQADNGDSATVWFWLI